MSARPRVLLCANSTVHDEYAVGEGLARLQRFADFEWLPSEGKPIEGKTGWEWGNASSDPADAERLTARIGDVDALIVCHGAPYVGLDVLDAAPRLKLIGELEGDRFANRIDVAAAAERGVRVTDTTHGSSLPVAEWALALTIVALRNAAEHYRRLIAGEVYRREPDDFGFRVGELSDGRVGLIGLGHIGRRLVELLRPFRCPVTAYDPYVAKEVALAAGVELAPLDTVFSTSEIVVCCAPITPRTHRMIGAAQLDLLRPDSVFVNVSRGAIVDPDALIARARRGDVCMGIDVFDPEPIPGDSEIRRLPNVFLSPHIAGVTAACRPRFFSLMVDELERYFGGRETLFDITPRVLANRRGLEPV